MEKLSFGEVGLGNWYLVPSKADVNLRDTGSFSPKNIINAARIFIGQFLEM